MGRSLGPVLIGIARLLYPGGNSRDQSTSGYLFFQNSLSDLGSTVAWGGQPNYRSALFFVSGSAILALAGIGCFAAFVTVYSSSRITRHLAHAAGVAGALSCVGLIGAALAPEDGLSTLHGQLTLLAARACPVASLLLALATIRDDRFQPLLRFAD